jgi:hypothetical protein
VSSIYFSLQNPIDVNNLIQKIQKLIHNNNNSNSILEITIKNIEQEDNGLIPKLEYKGE